MKVLVCGGRDYGNFEVVRLTMNHVHAETPITLLIHGGAPGADALADKWAREHANVPVHVVPANWREFGRAAGPIRNRLMLETCKPDLVVCFPGGRGTADMMRLAVGAGVRVLQVEVRAGPA